MSTVPTIEQAPAPDAASPAVAMPAPRRSFLAAALGGAAAVIASALGRPGVARAAAGDPVVAGQSVSAGSSATTVNSSVAGNGSLVGGNSSATGRGIYGKATATTGTNIGVYGSTASSGGRGVFGKATKATGTSQGVRGEVVSPDGWAIYGKAATSVGAGGAIRADGGPNNGLSASTTGAIKSAVRGTNSSTADGAWAIVGEITTTSPGGDSAGVVGWNRGTGGFGIGVAGYQDGSGWGVYGYAPSGHGVFGETEGATKAGIYGSGSSAAGVATGVRGAVKTGIAGSAGVAGTDASGTEETNGVLGETSSTNGNGVKGYTAIDNANSFGVFGYAGASGKGVVGQSSSGFGVFAISSSGTALRVNGHSEFQEVSAPANPVNNHVRLYARDNGAGKTQLVAHFPGGNIVVIGTSV